MTHEVGTEQDIIAAVTDLAREIAEYSASDSSGESGPPDIIEVDTGLSSDQDAVTEEPGEADADDGAQDGENEVETIAELIEPEQPLPIIQSFAERVQELLIAMDMGLADPGLAPEPENLTVTDYYDRVGHKYLGKLYTDAATGRDYKLVTWDERTVML